MGILLPIAAVLAAIAVELSSVPVAAGAAVAEGTPPPPLVLPPPAILAMPFQSLRRHYISKKLELAKSAAAAPSASRAARRRHYITREFVGNLDPSTL